MNKPNTNPFVLPGMGQGTDLSGNPLLASMEMMRQAWAGLAGSGGLNQSLPLVPPLNPDDLERRITELRTVEGWLRVNLQMLSSTIQGMEVQRATIATLRSFADGVSGGTTATGEASPLDIALGLKPASPEVTEPPIAATAHRERESPPVNAAAEAASQAWWDLLNQQFSQIAAATAASLPGMMASSAEQASEARAKPDSKTTTKTAKARKTGAKKTASGAQSKPATTASNKGVTAGARARKTPPAA